MLALEQDPRSAFDRRLSMLAGTAFAAFALALLSTAQAGVALVHDGQAVPWIGLLRARIVDWFAYALFVPALYRLVRRHPIETARWPRTLALYLPLCPAVAAAKETVYVAVGEIFRPGLFDLATILAQDFASELLTVWAIVGLLHAIVFHQRSANDIRRRQGAELIDRIAAHDGRSFHLIEANLIEAIEAQGNYACLSTPHGAFLLRSTMVGLERRLGPRFLRIHRRRIVNLDRVARIEPRPRGEFRLHLVSGACVASARSYSAAIRALLH